MNLCDLWCRERVETSASLNIPQYIGSDVVHSGLHSYQGFVITLRQVQSQDEFLTKQSIFANKVIFAFRHPVRAYYKKAPTWFGSWMKETLFVDVAEFFWETRQLALRPSRH